jgi:hypothetical protein
MYGGYSALQNWITNTVMRVGLDLPESSIAMVIVPSKTPSYDYDPLMKNVLAT